MKFYKSKIKSETTGEPYIIRIVMDNVEWVDNPNAPKSSTAPLLMTIVQRQKIVEHIVKNYIDDEDYKPFGIWQDNFNDFFEGI